MPTKCPSCGKAATYYPSRGFDWNEYMVSTLRGYAEDVLGSILCILGLLSTLALFGLVGWGAYKLIKIISLAIKLGIKLIF